MAESQSVLYLVSEIFDRLDEIARSYPAASGTRRKNAQIGIEVYRGKFRLRLNRELCGGKQKCIYTRLPDTNDGWREATKQVWRIEDDIARGEFDPTLAKYQPNVRLAVVQATQLTLLDLWDKYAEYRRPQVAVTHFRENYQKRYRNAILELPTQNLADAILVRDYLLKCKSAGTVKQLLIQFNAACKFGVQSRLISCNPFEGMAADIKSRRKDSEEIDPFSAQEREAIIYAFEQHPHHKHYAGFVRFLFLTGCRTSEAIGLRWGDINPGCSLIIFSSVISKGVRKATKTNKSRRFPCNQALQALLQSIRPDSPDASDLVFVNPIGKEINPSTFNQNAWGGDRSKGKVGIVQKLVHDGKVERYRPQYNTRHTFITMCLEQGTSIPQIARWVGNSPETILACYGGVLRQVQPPEI